MDDGRARVNRVWGVIDRTTNNLLGEFPTREEADEFFNELLAADHRAGLHVEVVEAKGHATGSRAAKGGMRYPDPGTQPHDFPDDTDATPDRAATAEELPSGGWIVNYGQPWNYRVFATKERADAFCEGYNAALEARDG